MRSIEGAPTKSNSRWLQQRPSTQSTSESRPLLVHRTGEPSAPTSSIVKHSAHSRAPPPRPFVSRSVEGDTKGKREVDRGAPNNRVATTGPPPPLVVDPTSRSRGSSWRREERDSLFASMPLETQLEKDVDATGKCSSCESSARRAQLSGVALERERDQHRRVVDSIWQKNATLHQQVDECMAQLISTRRLTLVQGLVLEELQQRREMEWEQAAAHLSLNQPATNNIMKWQVRDSDLLRYVKLLQDRCASLEHVKGPQLEADGSQTMVTAIGRVPTSITTNFISRAVEWDIIPKVASLRPHTSLPGVR